MCQWTTVGRMVLTLLCGVFVPVSALGDPPVRSERVRGLQSAAPLAFKDPDLGVEVEMTPGTNGSAVVRVVAGALTIEKTLRSDGSTTRVISARNDTVRITNDAAGTIVERGGRRAVWRAGDASEEAVEAVRALLLQSAAVKDLRRLGTVLEQRGGEHSAFIATILMDHAFVTLLDGDELAVRRFGERVAEHARLRRGRAAGPGMVPVSRAPVARPRLVPFRDCLGEFYDYVGRSWGQYEQCEAWAMDDPWYRRGLHLMWCQREFEIRMASGLLQFVDCSAFPD